MTHFKKLALAVTVSGGMLLSAVASADVILTFGQTSNTSSVSATEAGGVTTITSTDASINITQILAPLVTPLAAFLDLSATSAGPAFVIGGKVLQSFTGDFCITSAAGCGGTNYLSGHFVDAVFGDVGGAALTLEATQPPATLTFTSSVITILGTPRGMGFGFADVSPLVHVVNDCGGSPGCPSLAGFHSSVSGTFSANGPLRTPEPATLGLLGLALGLMGFVKRRLR